MEKLLDRLNELDVLCTTSPVDDKYLCELIIIFDDFEHLVVYGDDKDEFEAVIRAASKLPQSVRAKL